MERENLCFVTSEDVKGQAASGSNREDESTEAGRRGGAARSSVEGPVMGLERRGCVVRPWLLANWKQEEPVDEAKPFKQRSNIGSRVTREGHARFWERPEVKFLRATRQGAALEDLAKSREEREPMFIRKGDQLVPKLFRLGRLPCRKRRQANDEKRVCEGMGVAELPGALERLVHRLACLIGVAPMPERQCPGGDRGDTDIRAEPWVERPMLAG